jgi:hypothetical protein
VKAAGPISQVGGQEFWPGSGLQPGTHRETTPATQREDLTRMNHDHDDDADWLKKIRVIVVIVVNPR